MLSKLSYSGNSGAVREVGRYALATVFSATLSLTIPVILHNALGLSERGSVGAALAAVFAINFVQLRVFVFRSSRSVLPQILKFGINSAAFRAAEYIAFLALFEYAGLHYVVTLFIVLVISFFMKFLVLKKFVFSRGG